MREDDILKGAEYEQMMLWQARLGLRRWKALRPAGNARHEERALAPTASCSKDVSMLKRHSCLQEAWITVCRPRKLHEAAMFDTTQRAIHLRRADSMIARGGSSMPLASTRITPAQPNVAMAAILEGTLGDALESRQAKASERGSLTTTR